MEVVVFIIFVDPFDKKNKDIYLDEDIREFFFGEGIKKSFWKHLKESVILEPSTTKIKFLIHSRRIIVSDTRKKIDGVAVATARFSDDVAGQLDK